MKSLMANSATRKRPELKMVGRLGVRGLSYSGPLTFFKGLKWNLFVPRCSGLGCAACFHHFRANGCKRLRAVLWPSGGIYSCGLKNQHEVPRALYCACGRRRYITAKPATAKRKPEAFGMKTSYAALQSCRESLGLYPDVLRL